MSDDMTTLFDAEQLLTAQGAELIVDRGDFCLIYVCGAHKAAEWMPARNRVDALILAALFLRLTLADEKANPPAPSEIRARLLDATD